MDIGFKTLDGIGALASSGWRMWSVWDPGVHGEKGCGLLWIPSLAVGAWLTRRTHEYNAAFQQNGAESLYQKGFVSIVDYFESFADAPGQDENFRRISSPPCLSGPKYQHARIFARVRHHEAAGIRY